MVPNNHELKVVQIEKKVVIVEKYGDVTWKDNGDVTNLRRAKAIIISKIV